MAEQSIDLSGFNIAAKTWGSPKASPILALHGWLDNAASFDRLAPLIQNAYVVAIDLPGHGLSEHLPEGKRYNFIDSIFIVIDLIKALGWSECCMIGHSLGGAMAPIVAAGAPELIKKFVMIDAIGPYTKPDSACAEQLQYAVKQNYTYKTNFSKTYPDFAAAVRARHKTGHVSEDAAKILAERGTTKTNAGYIWHHDKKLMLPSPFYLTESQVLSCFAAIEASACFIQATAGLKMDAEFIKRRTHALKNLKMHHLRGGHHLHLENPEPVADVINGFLNI